MCLRGGSLMCVGVAGPGKTSYLQGVVERLRASGRRVALVSQTHVASHRAGGATADPWVRRNVYNGVHAADDI